MNTADYIDDLKRANETNDTAIDYQTALQLDLRMRVSQLQKIVHAFEALANRAPDHVIDDYIAREREALKVEEVKRMLDGGA